eukprot:Nk52_evm38s2612 gene=Nk52_evmTU38s2612
MIKFATVTASTTIGAGDEYNAGQSGLRSKGDADAGAGREEDREEDEAEEDNNDEGEFVSKEVREEMLISMYQHALSLHAQIGSGRRGEDGEERDFREEAKAEYKRLLAEESVQSAERTKDMEVLETYTELWVKFLCSKNLGRIYEEEQLFEEALKMYSEACCLDETDVVLWQSLGKTAIICNRIELARLAFEKGLECNPKSWLCLGKLCDVAYALGDYAGCIDVVRRCLRLDPCFAKGYVLLNEILKEDCWFKPHVEKCLQESLSKKEREMLDKLVEADDKQNELIKGPLEIRNKMTGRKNVVNLGKNLVKKEAKIDKCKWACVAKTLTEIYEKLKKEGSLNECVELVYEKPRSLMETTPMDIDKCMNTPLTVIVLDDNGNIVSEDKAIENGESTQNKKPDEKTKETSTKRRRKWEESQEGTRRSTRIKVSSQETGKAKQRETIESILKPLLPEKYRYLLTEKSDIFGKKDSPSKNNSLTESTKKTSNDDSRKNLDREKGEKEEEREVYEFLQTNVRNGGVLELVHKVLLLLTRKYDLVWTESEIIPLFWRLLEITVNHFPIFSFACTSENDARKKLDYMKAALSAAETKLNSTIQKGSEQGKTFEKEASECVEDFDRAFRSINITSKFDSALFGEELQSILCRMSWLKSKFYDYVHKVDDSLEQLKVCKQGLLRLTEKFGRSKINFPNCFPEEVLDMAAIEKKEKLHTFFLFLKNCSVHFESGNHEALVSNVAPLFNCIEANSDTQSRLEHMRNFNFEKKWQLYDLFHKSSFKLGMIENCISASEVIIEDICQRLTSFDETSIYWMEKISLVFGNVLDSILHKKEHNLLSEAYATQLMKLGIGYTKFCINKTDDRNVSKLDSFKSFFCRPPAIVSFALASLSPDADVDKMGECEDEDIDEDLEREYPDLYPVSEFLIYAHSELGRKHVCCWSKGVLLDVALFHFNNEVDVGESKDKLNVAVVECYFCLYGISLKPSRKANDHESMQVELTKERALNVSDYVLPHLQEKIAANQSIKFAKDTLERVLEFFPLPDKENPRLDDPVEKCLIESYEQLEKFLVGSLGGNYTLPQIVEDTKNASPENAKIVGLIETLYYHIAFALKEMEGSTSEFLQADAFFKYSIALNPLSQDKWFDFGAYHFTCLKKVLDGFFVPAEVPRNSFVCTINSFKLSITLKKDEEAYEEMGKLFYLMFSRYIELDYFREYSIVGMGSLAPIEPLQFLLSSRECFTKAHEIEPEEWEYYFMLGKISEKLQEDPGTFLDLYCKAYDNNPKELEVQYRIISSISKVLIFGYSNLNCLELALRHIGLEGPTEYEPSNRIVCCIVKGLQNIIAEKDGKWFHKAYYRLARFKYAKGSAIPELSKLDSPVTIMSTVISFSPQKFYKLFALKHDRPGSFPIYCKKYVLFCSKLYRERLDYESLEMLLSRVCKKSKNFLALSAIPIVSAQIMEDCIGAMGSHLDHIKKIYQMSDCAKPSKIPLPSEFSSSDFDELHTKINTFEGHLPMDFPSQYIREGHTSLKKCSMITLFLDCVDILHDYSSLVPNVPGAVCLLRSIFENCVEVVYGTIVDLSSKTVQIDDPVLVDYSSEQIDTSIEGFSKYLVQLSKNNEEQSEQASLSKVGVNTNEITSIGSSTRVESGDKPLPKSPLPDKLGTPSHQPAFVNRRIVVSDSE